MAARGQPAYVLDSFAILAYLGAESGKARVAELLRLASAGRIRILLSVINLGEVAYIVERERGLPHVHETLALIDQLPIDVLPAPREVVLAAAHIKAQHPLAYADAFAAAAAQAHDAVLLSGDPEFKPLKGMIRLERL